MSGTCEVPKNVSVKPIRKVEPVEEKDGVITDIHSKDEIEKMLDLINNSSFATGTARFRLNTDTDPWVIEVLDTDGNVIVSIPKSMAEVLHRDLIDSQDTDNKGLFLDTEV